MPLAAMNRLVFAHFCGKNSRFGSFSSPTRPDDISGREILPGTLYHYDLVNEQQQPVILQVYEGIGGLGEEMWGQEVAVLQRLTALQHPALPTLVHGSAVAAEEASEYGVEGYAFVITDAVGQPLHDPAAPDRFGESIRYFREHPDEAVTQLMSLADALTLLHGMDVVHRNIWPGSVEVLVFEERPVLRLARFEMSALVSNLLRSATRDARRRSDEARELLKGQGARALVYFPPDRIRALFRLGAGVREHPDDVYALGMVAAEWFTGPLPDDLVAAAEDALATSGTDPEPVVAAVMAVNRHVARALGDCHPVISALLRDMINLHGPSRPVAGAVVDRISDHFEALAFGTADGVEDPYLILFMPEESRATLLRWEWIQNDPDTPAGRAEVSELIETDLRAARLYHAPDGAAPFTPPQSTEAGGEALARATYLLLGHKAAWFCQEYQQMSVFSRRNSPPMENVLLVKYVIDVESGRGRMVRDAIREQRRYRVLPPVEVHPSDIASTRLHELADPTRSWRKLQEAVRAVLPPTPAERKFTAAFDWLLDFQQEEIAARRYPYTAATGLSSAVVLQYDAERDRRWMFSSAMASVFARSPRLRPAMGDFFSAGMVDGGEVSVTLRPDENGRPARGRGVDVEVLSGQHDIVEVRGGARRQVPSTGWIEFSDDIGTRVALGRQLSARWELLKNRQLVQQLDSPQSLGYRPLDPNASADAVISRINGNQPLFALQGPPGTGKTELAAQALCSFLEKEPFARVLVSAQSNFALDNIAERVLDKLGLLPIDQVDQRGDVVALRITTPERAGNVDQAVAPFILGPLADRTRDALLTRARGRLVDEPSPVLRQLLGDWADTVSVSLPELTDRLHRGANLVFATCSAATRRNLNRAFSADLFDWVIIEEAAKAWPTELAIPMARGGRWTLIGDHRQLPAHRRREIVEFLETSAGSGEEDLNVHGRRLDEYLDVLDLFGHMFDDDRLGELPRGFERPRFTLRTQYRMRDSIGQIVSRAFYPDPDARPDDAPFPPGTLRTGADHAPILRAPAALAHSAVVWVDTTGVPDCEDAPTWRNPGEVRIVEEILRQLRPRPVPKRDGYGPHPVAVLSPYRKQVDLMRGRAEIRDHVATIHAFQGRQADVVVVSLVRDRLRGPSDQPARNIGHLVQPELVNVLFSRARCHLVIVGSLDHFERCGDPIWAKVCALARHFGTVLPAAELDA